MAGEIKINCPECGTSFKVTLDDIAKQRTEQCPHGHSIEIRDKGAGVRKATKSLEDLHRQIKRLGR